MLRRFITRWSAQGEIEHQVEEELQFHYQMLVEEYREKGMPEKDARAGASARFGDIERARLECIKISKRSRPAMKLLRMVLLLAFAAGLLLRVSSDYLPIIQVGDVLMMIGMLGQLLLHLRGLSASRSLPVKGGPVLSIFGSGESSPVEAFDELGRTPVGRVMADKAPKDS